MAWKEAGMIIVCGLLAVALVLVVVALVREHRKVVERLTNAHAMAEEAWIVERRELVNRVQAPEFIPRSSPLEFKVKDPEPDEGYLVGQVNYDGGNGD